MMHQLTICYSILTSFCCLGIAASPALLSSEHVQAKAPIIEKRSLRQPFRNELLQKRASPYLNSNTESGYLSMQSTE